MKKYYPYIVTVIVACFLSVALNCLCCHGTKIAVIDINKVVEQSKDVKALQQAQQQKSQELQKWVESVKAEVAKADNKQKKDELTKKYDAEFMAKYQALQKEYSEAVQKLEAEITKTIENKAKADGYRIVLAKSTVLTGGKDITDEVIELVK